MPLEDFSGNVLQDLADLSTISQPIYYSSFSSEERGIFCLVWLDGYGDACEKYAESYLKILDDNKPHEMVSILFDRSENLFLKPDWWENLSAEQRKNLNDRYINNGSIFTQQKFSTLETADWNLNKTIIGF